MSWDSEDSPPTLVLQQAHAIANAKVDPRDLDTITTLLDLGALELTPTNGATFTREELYQAVRYFAGPLLGPKIRDTDLDIVLGNYSTVIVRLPGKRYKAEMNMKTWLPAIQGIALFVLAVQVALLILPKQQENDQQLIELRREVMSERAQSQRLEHRIDELEQRLNTQSSSLREQRRIIECISREMNADAATGCGIGL